MKATRSSAARMLAATAVAFTLGGCTALVGRPTAPLTIKREAPGVVLCMSERTSGGGLRLIGKVDPGIYPITRALLEYRTASPSDPAPTVAASGGKLALAGAHQEKIAYRKGASEVSYTIDGDAARGLSNKVLWYRWIIEYTRGSSAYNDATDVHRTSLDEAGVPRAPGNPGPDGSIAPATHGR